MSDENIIQFRRRPSPAPAISREVAMSIYADEVTGIAQAAIIRTFVDAGRVPGVGNLDLADAWRVFAATMRRELQAAQAVLSPDFTE